MLQTNKIHYELDCDKINADFDVFKITRTTNSYMGTAKIIDGALEDYHSIAVNYQQGNSFLILIKKGSISEYQFRKNVQYFCDSQNIESEFKITQLNINDLACNGKKDDELQVMQLLLNSLSNAKNEKKHYQNLTGMLLYQHESWVRKNDMHFLRIQIDGESMLQTNVVTFSKLSALKKYHVNVDKKARYILDEGTNRLRRKLSDDVSEDEQTYIEKPISKKHKNTVDFIDFQDQSSFYRTKMGITLRFLEDVEKYLSSYVKLRVEKIPSYKNVQVSHQLQLSEDDYKKWIQGQQIQLIDAVGNSQSGNLADYIQGFFLTAYGTSLKLGSENQESNGLTIKIIHNRDYYESSGIPDPHQTENSDQQVIQHVTIEDFKLKNEEFDTKKGKDARLIKIIQELWIKQDIQQNHLTIVEWPSFSFENDLYFAYREILSRKPVYYEMQIQQTGAFSIQQLKSIDSATYQIETKLNSFDKHSFDYNIEGLVYTKNDSGEIQNSAIIRKSSQYTIPALTAIKTILRSPIAGSKLNKTHLLELLDSFYADVTETEFDEVKAKKILSGTEDAKSKIMDSPDEVITLNDYRVFCGQSLFATRFRWYIFDEEEIVVNHHIRNESFRGNLLQSITDIRYYKEGDTICYFVGVKGKGMQSKIPRAATIRKIYPDLSDRRDTEILKLLPLLSATFVRNGQYTVLPFPFKYLREFINTNGNNSEGFGESIG